MNKLLTGDIWSQVNTLVRGLKNKQAAIAYVTTEVLELSKGDVLICNASVFAIKNGETSAKTLQYYFEKGVTLYSNPTLHSKILLTDKLVAIGSANLSLNSQNYLTEASIVTEDDLIISQSQSFLYNTILDSSIITELDLDKLLKILVTKRLFPHEGRSKTRNLELGSSYWVINVKPLSNRILDAEAIGAERAKKIIQRRTRVDVNDVYYIRVTNNSKLRKEVKNGDQVMIIWKEKSRTYVYKFISILLVQKTEKWTKFYYKGDNLRNVSWTHFSREIKGITLNKEITKNSVRQLSPEEAIQLKALLP